MLYSHIDIEDALATGAIECDPYTPDLLQVASLEVTLGDEFLRPRAGQGPVSTVKRDMGHDEFRARTLVLRPGDFVLGTTREIIGLDTSVAARFEGKSSLGRMGLITHVTAGFIDPGFRGRVTLEIANVSPAELTLEYGQKIGQLAFFEMRTAPKEGYGHQRWGSHYQGQLTVTGARG